MICKDVADNVRSAIKDTADKTDKNEGVCDEM